MHCVKQIRSRDWEERKPKIRGFVNLIEVLRSGLSSYTLPDLIKSLLERIDYAEYLRDQDEESAEDRLGNVDELITKAAVI